MQKRLLQLAVITVLLLCIPLALTIRDGNVPNVGWNWSPFDFVWAGTLIFGTGLMYECIARKAKNAQYRYAFIIGLAGAFTLIWVNGAVGIIGDGPANDLYFGVLLIGLIGSLLSRFQARGMSYALFAAATAQFMVPVIAFIIWKPEFSPGVVMVFLLNAFWVGMFAVSGVMFKKAAEKIE